MSEEETKDVTATPATEVEAVEEVAAVEETEEKVA